MGISHLTNLYNLCYYGGVGGADTLKRKTKNKRGIKNYPIPNYQGRIKIINPIDAFLANQPRSNMTLQEALDHKNGSTN